MMPSTFHTLFQFIPDFPALAANIRNSGWNNLLGLLTMIILPVAIYFFVHWLRRKKSKRLVVTLEKNRLYFPEFVRLTVINQGSKPIEIDNPLLVFSNLLIKRKLKLKGTFGYNFYPLYLDPGKSHELRIDMNCFYHYDPLLKRFPKATVYIREISGKYKVSASIVLRKSLFT